jgi:hypothetical protein
MTRAVSGMTLRASSLLKKPSLCIERGFFNIVSRASFPCIPSNYIHDANRSPLARGPARRDIWNSKSSNVVFERLPFLTACSRQKWRYVPVPLAACRKTAYFNKLPDFVLCGRIFGPVTVYSDFP